MSTHYIQVALEGSLKENAEQVLSGLGLDLPTAFRLFLGKVVEQGELPFQSTEDAETGSTFSPEEIEAILCSREEDRQLSARSGGFQTPEELSEYLNSLKNLQNS